MSQTLPYWLAANYSHGIGPKKFLDLLGAFQSIQAVFAASRELFIDKKINPRYFDLLVQPNHILIDQDLAWAEQPHHHLIAYDDPAYPSLLKEIASPPLVLYVHGQKMLLVEKQLAVVGTRHPTPQGAENAKQFSFDLAERGITVVSGLALGIDGAAHIGALTANGKTIAVMGTGLSQVYPRAHCKLAAQIAETGALVSEFPLLTSPQAKNFPRRNRIIAGLSCGVLVIEAALKSGSLITARLALEQGKDVYAIPGSIHNPLTRGCHYLLKQGAKLVEQLEDILEELPFTMHQHTSSQTPDLTALSAIERKVFQQIEHDITSIDVIILRSGLTASEVSSILLTLELQEFVQSVPGGYIRAIPMR